MNTTHLRRARLPVVAGLLAGAILCMACGIAAAAPYPTGGDQGGNYASGGNEKFGTGVDVPDVTVDKLPAEFALRMRSANPVRIATVFEFDLPKPATVTVKFFDIQGREVLRALNRGAYGAGTHRLEIPMGRLASGQYLCRLLFATPGAAPREEVRKILRLR